MNKKSFDADIPMGKKLAINFLNDVHKNAPINLSTVMFSIEWVLATVVAVLEDEGLDAQAALDRLKCNVLSLLSESERN